MKILVCISSVPDTTAKINFTDNNTIFDKNGVQFVINPHDEYCLNKAIDIQSKTNASITILTVGDTTVEAVMRKSFAIGANEGARINIDPKDSLLVAKEIAKFAKEGNYDLILTGKESIDYNGNLIPSLLAGLLDYPFINDCISLDVVEGKINAVREIENTKETIEVATPVIVAGQKGLVNEKELRIPNMRGIMQARTKQINVIESTETPSDIQVLSYKKPKERSSVKMVDADNVSELVRLLHEEAKVI